MTNDPGPSAPESEVARPPGEEGAAGSGLRTRTLVGAVAAVLLVLAVGGIVGGWLTPGARARRAVSDAFGTIRATDSVVLGVDDIVRSPITPELAPRAHVLAQRVPGALERLRGSLGALKGFRALLNQRDGELADALMASARERITMLEAAVDILETAERVSAALTPVREAWTLVADAAKLADQAAVAYDTHTRSGVSTSTQLTEEAVQKLISADERLATVERVLPEANVSVQRRYVTLRQRLASESLRIDAAWLAGDIERANRSLDSYIVDQSQLTELAGKLPKTETAPIEKAYAEVTGAQTTRYEGARAREIEADARVHRLQAA